MHHTGLHRGAARDGPKEARQPPGQNPAYLTISHSPICTNIQESNLSLSGQVITKKCLREHKSATAITNAHRGQHPPKTRALTGTVRPLDAAPRPPIIAQSAELVNYLRKAATINRVVNRLGNPHRHVTPYVKPPNETRATLGWCLTPKLGRDSIPLPPMRHLMYLWTRKALRLARLTW